jgi:hypothetical protein
MNTQAIEIIKKLGGTGKAADFFRVSPSAVSQWREKGIPGYRLHTLEHSHPQFFRKGRK